MVRVIGATDDCRSSNLDGLHDGSSSALSVDMSNPEASHPSPDVHCKCGAWSGERCQWSGSAGDTAVVEWMPCHLRGSHEAAGCRGIYGANGAQRIRVSLDCAKQMMEHDPDWCSIIGGQS
jgi:hypothetical protein